MEGKASPLHHPEPGSTSENQAYFHCAPFWKRESEQALIFPSVLVNGRKVSPSNKK